MWAKPKNKGGLYIRGQRGNPIVKKALIKYARWLRSEIDFPVKLPVYLNSTERIRSMDGDLCVSTIFLPWEPDVEPYVRMATGDYKIEMKKQGRNDTLTSYLFDLTLNILKYQYWVETGKDKSKRLGTKASKILDKYALTTDSP